MIKNNYNVIGIMSGTSLDGIDLVHVNFSFSESWSYRIYHSETVEYPEVWQAQLSEAVHYNEDRLRGINSSYTDYLAQVISEFMLRNEISEVDAVCSHGHTVKHDPENAYTLQIGNLPQLATMLNQTVICDFRVQDVQLGGQGAPLVPIGDELLFSQFDYCLNLGGFANVSTRTEGVRLAYDICAVNTVMNWLANRLGYKYDEGGKLAASGKINTQMLEDLERLTYYKKPPPKSLGIEWVHTQVLPIIRKYEDLATALHTYAVHIGGAIGKSLQQGRVLVTGGGAYNSFLVEQIRKHSSAEIIIPSPETVNFKEALIFAFLGVLKMREELNVLSAVTGASRDHCSGIIYNPE